MDETEREYEDDVDELNLRLCQQIASLESKNRRLREALEYYANPNNWNEDDWGIRCVISEYGDAGSVAKAALEGKDEP